MNHLFRYRIFTATILLLVLLSACGAPPAETASPAIHDTLTPAQPSPKPVQLREIPVESVRVEIGIGSPIPVHVSVSGTWPDLCAQLAEVQQEIQGAAVTIRLLATPKDETCPPDLLGLPFGIDLPLNMVEMPVGSYTVTVNEVGAAFAWDPANLPPVEENSALPPGDDTPAPAEPTFTATVYRDESAGFEFDYPASWTVDQNIQAGDRASISQLTSWAHAPGDISAEPPPGGTRLDVTLYAWEPKHDLDAYAATRQQAWDASGMSLQSQDAWTAGDGRRLVLFQVLGPDQQEAALFVFTTLGERYLALSGSGDLQLLDEIVRTLRFD